MKSKILDLFRSTQDIVSGETLSTALGISRVSVWKHIQKLQECGYEYEATPRGYKLLKSPDTPYPWEFPQREGLIHYFPKFLPQWTSPEKWRAKAFPISAL